MKPLLAALVAGTALTAACDARDVADELAGELAADDAPDGKADAAIDGSYTYYELWRDRRACSSPQCGGYFLQRLNRSTTICHDGASPWACYTPELDLSQSALSAPLQASLDEAAGRGALSAGAIAIVRGRFAPRVYAGLGDLGRFVVTEAWVAENDGVSDGVFVRARDNNVRCIQAPCPTYLERALNTSRSASIHAFDFEPGGFSDEQVGRFATVMVARPHGMIYAGRRYVYRENGQWAKGRDVTAAYARLEDLGPCYVGGCSSQLCSDQEDVTSSCDWREEYACYQAATCERQPDGLCGWTETPALAACLAGTNGP